MLSSFPNGFTGGVAIRGLPMFPSFATSAGPGNVTTPGVWYVDSVNGAAGNEGTMYSPLSTVASAITKGKAQDLILCAPNHAETLTTATSMSMSKAGVKVIGLGIGTARATFTYTTAATATIAVTAANVAFVNCKFVANFADIAGAFTTTTAKFLTLVDCEFVDTDATHNFLAIVSTAVTDNAADGLTLINVKQVSAGLTANTAVLDLKANVADLTVKNSYFQSLVAGNSGFIYQATTTKVITNAQVDRNMFNFVGANAATGALLITTATTHSGLFSNNYVFSARAVASAVLITASSGFKFAENYFQSVADKSGILLPVNA